MTVVLTEGFDMYNGSGSGTGLQARWTYQSGNNGVTMVAGRFGGQAMSVRSSGVFSTVSFAWFFPSSYTAMSIGFAYWPRTFTNATGRFFLVDSAGTTAVLQVDHNNTTGSIDIRNAAGTIVANSGPGTVLNNAAWYYIEIEIVTGNPTGQIRVFLNGTQFAALTGQNCGANPIQGVIVRSTIDGGGNSDTIHLYDDMYVIDAATRIGERKVETLRPASDVAGVQWTPSSGVTNFSRVNETTVDGDTSYVQTAGVGNVDFYNIGSLSSNPVTIDAINIVSFAEKTDAGPRAIYNGVNSGGTISNGTAFSLASSYGRKDRLLVLDPNGSIPWVYGAVNALKIGPNLAS